MSAFRAIAAAIVAVCILGCTRSLSAQTIASARSTASESDSANDRVPSRAAPLAEALRSSIGHRRGAPRFNSDADRARSACRTNVRSFEC